MFNVKKDPGEVNDLREAAPEKFKELTTHWEKYKEEVGVVGVAGEYPDAILGHKAPIWDEFDDPYGWIRLMGRPDRVPEHLKDVVPV